jgi:hypothetical protein
VLVEQADDRLGEDDESNRGRGRDEGRRPQTEREVFAEAVRVSAGESLGELGHEGGGDGDHEDPVGELKDHEGVIELLDAAEAGAEEVGDHLYADGRCYEDEYRSCEPDRCEEGGMSESRAGMVAEPPGRRDQHQRHHRDPERGPEGERVDRRYGTASDEQGVSAKGRDDDEVVQHRGEGG